MDINISLRYEYNLLINYKNLKNQFLYTIDLLEGSVSWLKNNANLNFQILFFIYSWESGVLECWTWMIINEVE